MVKALMRAQRHEMLVTRAAVTFEDDQGKVYEATGKTLAAAPWYNFNPASAAFQTLTRWEYGARVGYSHIADFAGWGFCPTAWPTNLIAEDWESAIGYRLRLDRQRCAA